VLSVDLVSSDAHRQGGGLIADGAAQADDQLATGLQKRKNAK